MIWFTADTHFHHAAVIDYCKRPFCSVEEMDEAMVAAWNARVSKTDIVYHLGDFALAHDHRLVRKTFGRLAGQKFLVRGNHDIATTCELGWAAKVDHITMKTIGDQQLVLCHYAMRVWPGQHQGAIQLYGHSHGNLPGTHASLDVGVDVWGFAPVSLEDIKRRLAETPAPESEPAGLTIP